MKKEQHYFKLHIDTIEDMPAEKLTLDEKNRETVLFKSVDKNVLAKIDDENTIEQLDIVTEINIKKDEEQLKDNIKKEDVKAKIEVKKEVKKSENEESKKSITTFKGVLSDIGRQLSVSLAVLVVGFFILNASSFYEIAQYKIKEFRGIESPLHQITEEVKEVTYSQEVLKTSEDPEVQKKQIPALDLEVAPLGDRIIIPRIDKNIPIVRIGSENVIKRDWKALETQMQDALKNGVVYYPGTSLPGQTGNSVITGHSSYFPWDPGRFKDVFALLHEVVTGDKIVVYHNQDKYLYEIIEIKVVLPEDVDVLKQTPDNRLTLITCTPVGTNLKRLIIVAKPIQINNQEVTSTIRRRG